MNKNLYFKYAPDKFYNDDTGLISLGSCEPKKEKKMDYSKKPYTVDTYNTFETLAEATKYARKCTMDRKEDTVIQQNIAVVKFPVPDYEVETLATVA